MTPVETNAPVVVTGGAGAIGSVLVRELIARGRDVRVIDNFSSGRREHLPKVEREGQLQLHVTDLREPDSLESIFRGTSEVWHLAANPDIRRGTADPRLDLENGILATFHVLEAARRAGIGRVFFASSSVVYGQATVFPTPESYGPLLPQSQYAAAKLASEGLCAAYAYSYGMRAFLFRFANIIGPSMTHGILYDFFEKLHADPSQLEVLGDGRQAKSYLRTEDCVGGMLTVAGGAGETVNLYNLGSADRISVREIAERVVAAHPSRARIVFTGGDRGWIGDIPQQLLAIDRVQALGWRPHYSSAQAVEVTIREMAAARGI